VIYDHIQSKVLQGVFRFARNGQGTIVYVKTGVLPDWVPTVAEPSDTTIKSWREGQRDIISALAQLGRGRAKEVAEEADRSSQYARQVLNELCQHGVVSKKSAEDGRGDAKIYVDDGIASLGSFALVDLPALR
jgi:hypothetical protein